LKEPVPLLQAKRHPAPAIHMDTLAAITQRNNFLVKSHLTLAAVYPALTDSVEISRDYSDLE
jgi:hypothetical protein